MGQIELSATLTSSMKPVELMNKVCALAGDQGITVARVAENQADFRRGSQVALRIKGGIFSKISDFPVVAVIRCDETPSGSNVVIRSLDDLGVGTRLGMTKKYTEAVREMGSLLAQIVNRANA